MHYTLRKHGILAAAVSIAYMVGFVAFYIAVGTLFITLFPGDPNTDSANFGGIIVAVICAFIGGWVVSMFPARILHAEPRAHLHFGYLAAIAVILTFAILILTPRILSLPFRGLIVPMALFITLSAAYLLAARLAAAPTLHTQSNS